MDDRLSGTLVIVLALSGVLLYVAVTAAIAPPLHHAQEAEADGPTLVGSFGTASDGNIVQLAPNGSIVWERTGPVSYSDVSRMPDGTILAGFQAKRSDGSEYTGAQVIDRETESVVWEYTFDVHTGQNSEVHDVEYLPQRNEFLFVDMDHERLFTVDRTTKRITWQWNASEQFNRPENYLRSDWLHMNDVDHIGGDQYLVSVRNANQLLIVTRGEGVTEVINKDGSRETLFEQHNPQWLGDGAVLVADSENDRVVELHRNETTGEWEVAWKLRSVNGVPLDWPRDADRLANGNTLVLDTRNARLVEVTEAGDPVWSAPIPEQGYDADREGQEYPAGPAYTAAGDASDRFDQPFHAVDTLYGSIRYTVPLPYWVTDWHVLVTLLGLVLAGVGAWIRWRAGPIDAESEASELVEDAHIDEQQDADD